MQNKAYRDVKLDNKMAVKYNHKIPSSVRNAMETFTSHDCFLIRNKRELSPDNSLAGNCHFNVEKYVGRLGGKRLSGWLLTRDVKLINHGIWVWAFHSVWEQSNSEIFDVTDDELYQDSESTTVWLDDKRDIDLVEGLNFNNIVVIEKSDVAKLLYTVTGSNIVAGEIYWTNQKMDVMLPLGEHSGIYRWLDPRFPKNIELFEKEHNCRIEGGRIRSVGRSNDLISKRALFDYGIAR